MAAFSARVYNAAKLNVNTYEEVEHDTAALGQSFWVVVLSSVAAGVGSLSEVGLGGLFVGTAAALVGWLSWAYLTYYIGAKMFPQPSTQSDFREMLRTIGFASSPGIVRILGVIPGLAPLVFFIASIWMFAAMVVAVRQALDYTSTLRAIGVCIVGWIIQVIVIALFLSAMAGVL
jgi:hypothetical protein